MPQQSDLDETPVGDALLAESRRLAGLGMSSRQAADLASKSHGENVVGSDMWWAEVRELETRLEADRSAVGQGVPDSSSPADVSSETTQSDGHEDPEFLEGLAAARTAEVAHFDTTGKPVMVTRVLSPDGRSATYGASYEDKATTGHRTFDEALEGVGLKAHRSHGQPSEIRPIDNTPNEAATAAIDDARRDWEEAAKAFAAVDVTDGIAYEATAAAEERTWAAYQDIYQAVHGENASMPAEVTRTDARQIEAGRREEATQFDALADRAAAQQPPTSAGCGQTVQATQMPCLLSAGHRGRHRSR